MDGVHLLAGALAKTTSPQEVGRATGELCAAMAKVDLGGRAVPIPPYYEVFDVHHAINREKFYKEADSNPAFEVCQVAQSMTRGKGVFVRLAKPCVDSPCSCATHYF